jgi:hypothetical protein
MHSALLGFLASDCWLRVHCSHLATTAEHNRPLATSGSTVLTGGLRRIRPFAVVMSADTCSPDTARASWIFEIPIVKNYPRARVRRLSRTQSATVGKLPVSTCQCRLVSTADIPCPKAQPSRVGTTSEDLTPILCLFLRNLCKRAMVSTASLVIRAVRPVSFCHRAANCRTSNSFPRWLRQPA